MRLKRFVAVVLGAAMAIGLVTSIVSAETKTKYPYTLKDSLNRSVTVKKAPTRIISISPATTEILFALGLGPKVVGVTNWCDYPAEAKKREKIGTFSDPSVEKIVALQPDLIVGAAGVSLKALEKLDSLGFSTIVADAKDIAGIEANIMDIAVAANITDDGKALVSNMEKRLDKVVKAVKTVKDRPKVFYEVWNDPLMTAGPGTFIDDVIKLAGGVNVAADAKSSWPTHSLEVLVKDNPEVILYAHMGESPTQIKVRKGWETIKAIKNGRIIKLPDENVILRPGPRIVDGLEDIVEALHPGLLK